MACGDRLSPKVNKMAKVKKTGLYLCQGESEECEKLHHLLVEPHSRYQYNRHDHALVEFLDYHSNGFRLCELEHVQHILQALFSSVQHHPVNKCHIALILQLCGKGAWWKQRMQEETQYLKPATNLLSYLGSLLLNEDAFLKPRLIETLLSLCTEISEEGSEEPLDEQWRRVSPAFLMRCFESSTVHGPLLKVLKDQNMSFDMVVDALMILKRLGKRSCQTCENILKSDGVDVVCGLLNVPGDEYIVHRIKFWCLEILSVLMRVAGEKAVSCIANKECVQRLRDGLFRILPLCTDKRMRQLRNDFLNLLVILVRENPHLPYLMPGFAKELVLLATYPEVKHSEEPFLNQQLAQVPEDYEMKQLLYIVVLTMSATSAIKQVVNPPKLLEALIMYLYPVIPSIADFQSKRCPIIYKRKLQELALEALAIFAPMFLTAYLEGRGNVRILEQINWCYVKGFLKSESISYERDSYFKALLQVLVRVVDTEDHYVLEELSILAAVPLLISLDSFLAMYPDTANRYVLKETIEVPLHAPPIDNVLEIESSAFIILAALCDAKDEFKVWIGTGGLALVVNYLRVMTKEEAVRLPKYNLLLASCINFIWCTVVGVPPVEKKFRELEGIFLILEILNLAHPSMQSMLLACLMDLCINYELVESCLEWRGPNNMTSPQLFCRIWREEERRIGALRDEKDKITDIEMPLMGIHQASIPIRSHYSLELSPALLDVSENFRVNIYGIIERMKDVGSQAHNDSLHPVELMKLSLENMMTLAIIEGYLDLKGTEVWNEVLAELEDDDLQPLLSDQEFVNSVARVNHTRGQSALSFQEQFANLSHDEKNQEEKSLYQQMRTWRDQKLLTLERIHTFLTATTDYNVLRSIKDREQLMINVKRTSNTMRRLEDEKTQYVAKKQLRP